MGLLPLNIFSMQVPSYSHAYGPPSDTTYHVAQDTINSPASWELIDNAYNSGYRVYQKEQEINFLGFTWAKKKTMRVLSLQNRSRYTDSPKQQYFHAERDNSYIIFYKKTLALAGATLLTTLGCAGYVAYKRFFPSI